MSSFFGFGLRSSLELPCASVEVLSGWGYGADKLSFFFQVSTWFFFSILGASWRLIW